MAGSLIFYEAESIEEVRNLVESDIYYTSGVVRLLPFLYQLTVQLICLFHLVGQGEGRCLTFCSGDTLAVDINSMVCPQL